MIGPVRTIKVGGADKGDMDTKVSVVGGAVEAEVDAKRDRRPRRVLLSAVKADLLPKSPVRISMSPC